MGKAVRKMIYIRVVGKAFTKKCGKPMREIHLEPYLYTFEWWVFHILLQVYRRVASQKW